MHCEWDVELESCGFAGNDFGFCPELGQEDCESYMHCEWDADLGECGFGEPGGGHGGGWDFELCPELGQEDCDATELCEWDVETETCGFANGHFDFEFCPELSQEDCDLAEHCLYDEETGECGFDGSGGGHGGGHGGGMDFDFCADLDQDDCDAAPFCGWDAELGECGFEFGWGCDGYGNGSINWGWGEWNWEDNGFSRGDINVDLSLDVMDIVAEVGFILENDAPTDYEFWAGDMNTDVEINILDITSMVNQIINPRNSGGPAKAELINNQLYLTGAVGGIQFNGSITSAISSNDVYVSENGITLIYNLSGELSTKVLTFAKTPEDLTVASTTGSQVAVTVAENYSLLTNYPNPFNPTTEISYIVPQSGLVSIAVYNTNGQRINSLMNQYQDNGSYSINWNGLDNAGQAVPSGVYFVRLEHQAGSVAHKVTLLK